MENNQQLLKLKSYVENLLIKNNVTIYSGVRIDLGKRYAKLVKTSKVSGSVYCFVDLNNGDILKPAGWSKPAKTARGNIFNENTWSTLHWTGPAYLRN